MFNRLKITIQNSKKYVRFNGKYVKGLGPCKDIFLVKKPVGFQ